MNPRHGVQRATFEVKALPLSGEWAYRVACEKFGRDLVDSFPRFTRGPRKGQLKGYLCYIKASVGGWSYNVPGYPQGRVVYPGCTDWKLAMADQYNDPKEHSTVARWHPKLGAEALQSPEAAAALFKTYGKEPRYA